jgi:C-methyltransferase C-terminal domain/Putative zinc binding domain/Methyltransferase domain
VIGEMKVCRACKSERVQLFLPLGAHPPANRFLTAAELEQPEPRLPLNAHVCLDCALIQVPDQLPPDFFRHYLYVPSMSTTAQRHFAELAETLVRRLALRRDALVVDIGCNDGLFLGSCAERGVRTLGIEPAVNLTAIARQKGLHVVNEYFSPETARQVRDRWGTAAAVVTTNTLNHIDDLQGFVEGVALMLADNGVFVVEVPQALDLIANNEFDTIYHEHLSEFSVRSLVALFDGAALEVWGLEPLTIHGGSMRVYGQRAGGARPVAPAVGEWLKREIDAGLFRPATYAAFGERVRANGERLVALLQELRRAGRRLAGYGAPAKGNTLLNYYGIDGSLLDFLADRSALKHGLYSPGAHIPVVPVARILETQPDYLLILAWNFADEIIEQQAEYRRRGGRFIVPIPEPRVVG